MNCFMDVEDFFSKVQSREALAVAIGIIFWRKLFLRNQKQKHHLVIFIFLAIKPLLRTVEQEMEMLVKQEAPIRKSISFS